MAELANVSNTLETVLIGGDLAKLSPQQRVSYYQSVCTSLGLNPLTKPFDYIKLNGRLVLYARKDAAEQLRKLHSVSISKLEKDTVGGVYVVTAYATMGNGRTDASTGAVSIENLKGDALANAIMKAETKAKRRVTLSICGLGMLDETEIETIPSTQAEVVEMTQDEFDQTEPVEFDNTPHWIEDSKTRNKFWAEMSNQGLDSNNVHEALGVKHIKDFDGSVGDAKTKIDKWIKLHVTQPGKEASLV